MKDFPGFLRYYKLWTLMHEVEHTMSQVIARDLKPLGITPRQALSLDILRVYGKPLTPAGIARLQLRKRNSIRILLNRMEKEGLLKQTRDLEQKNQIRLSLTEKGNKASDLSAYENLAQVFSSLSEEECQQMTSLLDRLLNRALDELGVDDRIDFNEIDKRLDSL
jgi:DNA-binding MarR family transcriptional regulator